MLYRFQKIELNLNMSVTYYKYRSIWMVIHEIQIFDLRSKANVHADRAPSSRTT